ncbi:MAG: hypothetical protein ACXADW_16660 [Candidatus Hodarchaeales archaeon]
MIEWTIFFVVWSICGVLAYGLLLAEFTNSFHLTARLDMIFIILLALLGPMTLIATLSDGGWKYGLMFRRPKEKEKVDYSFPEGEPDWEI